MATSTSNPWEKIEIPEICLFNLHSRACHGSIFKEREECTKYFPFISILTVWNVKITLSQRNPHHCTPVSVKRDQHLVAQNYLRGMEAVASQTAICPQWNLSIVAIYEVSSWTYKWLNLTLRSQGYSLSSKLLPSLTLMLLKGGKCRIVTKNVQET